MNINVVTIGSDVSVQLLDALQAYCQSELNLVCANWIVQVSDSFDTQADVNIIWSGGDLPDNHSSYDLVILSNGGEPITVSNPTIYKHWERENVFLAFNSLVTSDHLLHNKLLYFPDPIQQCRDYWTRYFYPHYYIANRYSCHSQSEDMVVVTGANRTVRHYVNSLILKHTNIKLLNGVSEQLINTNHSYWESTEDFEFRNTLEEKHQHEFVPESDSTYYSDVPTIGIDGKFGEVPRGYELMPEYFTHRCIIFPESTWQNNELAMTEKALKCFYAGSLPFPVAGANVNKLYNSIGYATAWNLLPNEHQTFDSELDHFKRIDMMIDALKWIEDNSLVLQSDEFAELTRQNKLKMLTYSPVEHGVNKLVEIIDECRRRH